MDAPLEASLASITLFSKGMLRAYNTQIGMPFKKVVCAEPNFLVVQTIDSDLVGFVLIGKERLPGLNTLWLPCLRQSIAIPDACTLMAASA